MKLLLVSDLHGQKKTLTLLERLRENENPDAVIVSGDITGNDKEFAKLFLNCLEKFKSAFFILGNADQEIADFLEETRFSIASKCRLFEKEKFCGLSYPEDDPTIAGELEGSIFVTHRPPVKQLVEKSHPGAPKYHISGHLHTAAFRKKYPSTIHIQVPTLQDARYAIFDTTDGSVEFKTI